MSASGYCIRRADARPPTVGVLHPDHIEADYRRMLVGRVHAAQQLLLRGLGPLLQKRRAAEERKDAEPQAQAAAPTLEDFLRVISQVEAAYTTAFPADDPKLGRLAKQLDLFTSAQVARQIKTIAAIDIGQGGETTALYKQWTDGNVALIKSIKDQHFSELREKVYAAIKSGASTQSLAEDIQSRYLVSRSRAQLIARDQIAKLNGEITMYRQVSVGVKRYRWVTSNDERVRPSHRALNGKIFSWDSPPPEGHPGWPIQCRCGAVPIWDDNAVDRPAPVVSRKLLPPTKVPSGRAPAGMQPVVVRAAVPQQLGLPIPERGKFQTAEQLGTMPGEPVPHQPHAAEATPDAMPDAEGGLDKVQALPTSGRAARKKKVVAEPEAPTSPIVARPGDPFGGFEIPQRGDALSVTCPFPVLDPPPRIPEGTERSVYTMRAAVPVAALRATQSSVDQAKVISYLLAGTLQRVGANGELADVPVVIQLPDQAYAILDGHHRLSAAKWGGTTLVTADVYTGPVVYGGTP